MTSARLFPRLIVIGVFLSKIGAAAADPVDDYIRGEMNRLRIPGVVVVVLKDGKVIKLKSYGLANIELNVPVSIDSVFPLASVTKVFTATAAYLLVEEGKIHLDDK